MPSQQTNAIAAAATSASQVLIALLVCLEDRGARPTDENAYFGLFVPTPP